MTLPTLQIGGLASGLDTNAIIAGLIEVEQIPVQQLEARKAEYSAKDAAWQTINTRFSAIRSALDAVDSLTDLNKLVSAASSNESAVLASPTGAATPGTVSFTVDALAANHQVASTTNFTGGDALVGAGAFTITIDGVDHTVTAMASTTLNELAQSINALGVEVAASVISVDGTDHKLMLTADDTGLSGAFTTSGTIASLTTTSVVQQAADAQMTLGSGAGALTITRSSNTVTDLVSGVSIELKETTTSAVTITIARDVDAGVEKVKGLVDAVNSALTTMADYTRYDSVSETAGILAGDSAARSLAFDLRSALSSVVNQESGEYAVPSSIGISLNRSGTFDFDETKLRGAMESDFDAVAQLFTVSGGAVDGRLSYVSKTAATVDGAYEVVVTQAATQAEATGSAYFGWFFDRSFDVTYDGNTTTVTVPGFASLTAAVNQINSDLDAAGITQVRATVESIGGGDQAIKLATAEYGSGSSFLVEASAPFGLGGTHTGADVAGTIGGQAATGTGQLLTASGGDPEGVQVSVTATAAEVAAAGGSLSLGDVVISSGMMGALGGLLDEAEGSGGKIARARDLWQAQVDLADERIETLLDRIDRKEALLLKQFAGLESAMATLSTQAAWLSSQLGALNANTPS
jgi:flagellar hook-associated protein 2